MIGTDQSNCERLYLHKDNENEIYVDNSQNLKQHQIDSLRFLYRQFVKKKNGAVLNFPAGSGKSLVVALFLNALSSLLKERVLILCFDDEEMEHWKQLFLTWTSYKSDEIAVESSNPRLKKKIFLKKAEDLTSYFRCHWSVVVIKDEHMCKTLQKVVLEADLKIWITSTDVKKDITLLSFIYNWIFPKSNVNINEIISNQDKPENKMVQSIIMDTVLEDFVIRENKVKVIKETKNSEMLKIFKDNNQKGTTRKNKDATGNKTKRSKRNIDVTPKEQTNNLPDVLNISTEVREQPGREISGHMTDMEIDDKSGIHADIDVKVDTDQVENDSFDLLQFNQNHTIKTEKNTEELLNFKEAVNDIVLNENIVESVDEKSTEILDFRYGVAKKSRPTEILEFDEENSNSTESLDFGDGVEKNSNTKETLNFEGAEENLNPTEIMDFGVVEENSNTESLDFGDGVEKNSNTKETLNFEGAEKKLNPTEIMDFGVVEENSNTESLDFEGAEEKSKSTDILDFEDETEIILDNNVLDMKDKTINNGDTHLDNIKDIENDNKMDLNTNSVTTEKSDMDHNLEFKMSELEERTMKKFKGSLLDSLF